MTNGFAVRLRKIKAMHEIVLSMNHEGAYYDRWILVVPDQPTEEDFEELAEDEEYFGDAVRCFKGIIEDYLEDGLYIAGKLY